MCARVVQVGGRAGGCVLWGVGWVWRVGRVRARVRMLGWRCVAEFGAAMRSPSVARLVCRRASEGRETRFYLVRNKMCHYVQVQVTRQHSAFTDGPGHSVSTKPRVAATRSQGEKGGVRRPPPRFVEHG